MISNITYTSARLHIYILRFIYINFRARNDIDETWLPV